ncbi:MAG: hypothetical protein HQ472_04300 [Ignavibacteria bacterium]|nr:hypothetical protein [Ignavibacteria bacterium]
MNKYKTIVFAAITSVFLLATHGVFSQEKFKVLAARGSITASSGQKIRVGTKLKTSDKLTIGKGAYLSLAHINGRTFELKKDGQYKVSDLDATAVKKSKSASSKYASYIVDELTEVQEPVAVSENRRAYMRTTGAVERAVGDEVSVADSALKMVGAPDELFGLALVQKSDIANGSTSMIFMPRNARVLPGPLQFMWYKVKGAGLYTLEIRDRLNNVVVSKKIADTIFVTSNTELKLQAASLYYWTVTADNVPDKPSDETAVYVVDDAHAKDVSTIAADIRSDFEDGDQAVMHLVLASMYEEYGLTNSAHEEYQSAMKTSPNVWNYKTLYSEFLKRHGLPFAAYTALW